jgi:hypothetical protein
MGRDLPRKDAVDLGKVLVELGNTTEGLDEARATFATGQRVEWRLR